MIAVVSSWIITDGCVCTIDGRRANGRRANGIELRREQCEAAVRRLTQLDLGLSAPGERPAANR
jgi:hypothetical protein